MEKRDFSQEGRRRKSELDGPDTQEFVIQGDGDYLAFKPESAETFDFFTAKMRSNSLPGDMLDAALELLQELLHEEGDDIEEGEEDAQYEEILDRLDERDITPDDILVTTMGLMEVFIGRPLGRSSGSSRSRTRTGKRSRGRQRSEVVAARSRTARRSSATSSTPGSDEE